MDLQTPFHFDGTTHPELGGGLQQGNPLVAHEFAITGSLVVTHHGEGDVGDDMMLGQRRGYLLPQPGPDVDGCVLGRLLLTAEGTLPGEQGTLIAIAARLGTGLLQIEVAIAQQLARDTGLGKQVQRQQEYLGIPEHMALVAFATESLGRDAAPLIVRRCHRLEVIEGKVQGDLILIALTLHQHPALQPVRLPLPIGVQRQGIPTEFGMACEVGQGRFGGRLRAKISLERAGDPAGLLEGEAAPAVDMCLDVLHQATILGDEAALGLLRHPATAADDDLIAAIQGAVVTLQILLVEHPHAQLLQMLATRVGEGGIDTCGDLDLGRAIQRGDRQPGQMQLQRLGGQTPGAGDPVAFTGRRAPDQVTAEFAIGQVQLTLVLQPLAPLQREDLPLDLDAHADDVGQVHQFVGVTWRRAVEETGDEHAAHLLGIILLMAGPDADITITRRHQAGVFIEEMQIKSMLCVNLWRIHS
ncbi:hypothetical protein D3C84_474820 [compost metagenome]